MSKCYYVKAKIENPADSGYDYVRTKLESLVSFFCARTKLSINEFILIDRFGSDTLEIRHKIVWVCRNTKLPALSFLLVQW